MKRLFLIALWGLSYSMTSFAQTTKAADSTLLILEDTLNVLSYSFVNDIDPNTRFASCNIFIKKLVAGLKENHSFNYPFERLAAISIQYPPDSSFRIFSWQLKVDAGNYRHYGAIQMNAKELQLFPLIDRSFEFSIPEDTLVTNREQWYGALYYNIIPHPTANPTHYLLFGLDGYNDLNRRKIIEVLHFDESGQPIFGKKVFSDPYDPNFSNKTRIIVEYAADAATRVNFDRELGMVIHDHIILADGKKLPDGSYVGFKAKKVENQGKQQGQWERIDKVFHQRSAEPPRLDNAQPAKEQYDLFGKKITKN